MKESIIVSDYQAIEKQQNKYSWEFIYLGANQDSFSVAGGLGIRSRNTTDYQATAKGANMAFASMDSYTSSYRSGDMNIKLDNANDESKESK